MLDGAASADRPPTRPYAALLWALTAGFFLRVLGQALVAFLDVRGLPSMSEWYSGLVPYPLLLPIQLLIVALLVAVCSDFSRGTGLFVEPRPRLGRWLRWLSGLYFAGMAARYAVTMALHPERRWLGTGTIPIIFHWVLAAFLFVFAHFHIRAARAGGPA